MLLKITNTCHAACFHCLENASPKPAHMTFPTLVNAMRFIKELNPSLLLVSGGEPSTHPLFHEFMGYIRTYYDGIIIIASNGAFINEGNESVDSFMSPYALDPKTKWQITNDSRYYPKPINREFLEYAINKYQNQVLFIDSIQQLYPQGRAVTSLKLDASSAEDLSSKCFNIRSSVRAGLSLSSAVKILESRYKFCTPSITYRGDISVGESINCPPIANVHTYKMGEVETSIRNSKCNECNMNSRLPEYLKQAINLFEID
ncbi:radical SAM protein [Photobacterium damselae]|uniref:radical SAM protein n=1 Tax=Photobacterium damselae TaxID=38293 RepID=UPI0040685574